MDFNATGDYYKYTEHRLKINPKPLMNFFSKK